VRQRWQLGELDLPNFLTFAKVHAFVYSHSHQTSQRNDTSDDDSKTVVRENEAVNAETSRSVR